MCRMIIAVGGFSYQDIFLSLQKMASAETANNEYVDEGKAFCHYDGWGAAYLKDGMWSTHKSLTKVVVDVLPEDLFPTTALALHARAATVGDETLENTHPFVHQETGLILFHNGTIQIPPEPVLLKPKGHTDSEKLFLCIVEHVLEGMSVPDAIDKELSQLEEFWGANLIVLTKTHAFVTVLHKITPRYYTMHLGVSDVATILSSELVPIEGVTWTPVENKSLIKINLDDASFEVHHFPNWG